MRAKRSLAIAVALLGLASCATVTTVSTVPARDCSVLDWDACAVAPNCRHGRMFVSDAVASYETFTCEQKHLPLQAPSYASTR